jgi:hypothetical protein
MGQGWGVPSMTDGHGLNGPQPHALLKVLVNSLPISQWPSDFTAGHIRASCTAILVRSKGRSPQNREPITMVVLLRAGSGNAPRVPDTAVVRLEVDTQNKEREREIKLIDLVQEKFHVIKIGDRTYYAQSPMLTLTICVHKRPDCH